MSKPNITRVQSATQWTASVHTLHMSKPNVTLYTCPHPKDYSQSFLKYKRSARFEVRGPRSEVRGPRSEVRGSRSEVRGSRSEVRGPRFEVRGPRFEVRGARCEVRGARCEVRGARSEVRGTRSEVRGPRCEVRGSRSEVRGPRCEVRGARYEVRGARCEVVRSRRFHCQVRSQMFWTLSAQHLLIWNCHIFPFRGLHISRHMLRNISSGFGSTHMSFVISAIIKPRAFLPGPSSKPVRKKHIIEYAGRSGRT